MHSAFKHSLSKKIGLLLTLGSLAFHLLVLFVYKRQPDTLAAFTVFPIWLWGCIGLILSIIAFLFFRVPAALFSSAVWIVTILLVSDETHSLARIGEASIKTGKPAAYDGQQVLRVITINWSSNQRGDLVKQISQYQPDIVFLQEIPHPYRIRQLTQKLFEGRGEYRYNESRRCAIISKGRIIDHQVSPHYRSILTTVQMPNGKRLELMNLHLQSACTDLRLWTRKCWHNHKYNRKLRRLELETALINLRDNSDFPYTPTIIAGDFNAPANDRIYRMMKPHFLDSFREAGKGWGNSYHRRLPLLRIDNIYASERHFIPVRSCAITIPQSDHRMVISDLIYK